MCIRDSTRPDLSSYAPVVPDLHPGCGPLSGIEAALAATTRPLNLFLPVDLPLLPARFLSWMLRRAEITGALVTVPRANGRPQPLCAVYHRDLLAGVTASLAAGNYKVCLLYTSKPVSHPISKQQALNPMRPVAIISKPQKEELAQLLPELVTWMRAHDFEPILDHVSGSYTQDARIVPRHELPAQKPVLVVVLGGDGTLLALSLIHI